MPSSGSFTCPVCREPSQVGKYDGNGVWRNPGGRWQKNTRQWIRTRTCSGPERHEFETVELALPIYRLAEYSVEPGPQFNHGRLLADVTTVLRGVLEGHQIAEIVDVAERQLLADLDKRSTDRKAPIRRRDVAHQVGRAIALLAGEHSVLDVETPRDYLRAHVLWVLARGGFTGRLPDAGALLKWMEQHGYTVGKGTQAPHYGEVRVDDWHPLKVDAAPQPRTVVFLVRTHVSEERYTYQHITRPYDHARLVESVARALSGVKDQERTSNYVVQWCLWALAGQAVVRAADLASMVSHCLRKVDDLGYLSWVTRVRNLDISQIHDEAVGLVVWPSPKLRFNPDVAADPRRQRNWDLPSLPELPWVDLPPSD